MADYKRQHFVPQFYLKNFSSDGVHICALPIRGEKPVRTQIKTSCQENYFYGANVEIERSIGEFEGKQHAIISKIVENSSLDGLTETERLHLRLFFTMQYSRTKDMKENFFGKISDHIVETQIKPRMKLSEELKNQGVTSDDIDSIKLSFSHAHLHGLLIGLCSPYLLLDLDIFLLHNYTENEFITSDAPISINNYINIPPFNFVGLSSQGLQLFCPISPKIAILFVDKNAYRIDSKNTEVIEIRDLNDIDNINLLQALHCQNVLFFQSPEKSEAVIKLINRAKKMKQPHIFIKQRFGNSKTILSASIQGINYHIKFSFIKLEHGLYKKIKIACKQSLKNGKPITIIRNRKLMEITQGCLDKMRKTVRSTQKNS